MTSTTSPRCDFRSDHGLGCARAAHAEGAHWLTGSADAAHADLRRIGFFRSADAEAAAAAVEPAVEPAATGETTSSPCPKLTGLGRDLPHVVGRRGERIVRGRRRERCTYCSRSVDLGPAELAVR